MKTYKGIKTGLVTLAVAAAIVSCKKDDDDTTTLPSLGGSMKFDMEAYVELGRKMTLTPSGVYHPEGGGVLYNQAPHNIDLFQWIPDMMPNKVHAFCHFGKWHNIEVEDDVTAYFEYPNGATGVFITTTGDNPGTNRLEICGDKGKLVCDDELTFYKLEKSLKEFTFGAEQPWDTLKCEKINIKVEGDNPQHVGILNNFANAVLGLEPLYAPAADGIKGVMLANAMLLSGWTGEAVELPIDGKKFYDMLQQHIKDSKFVKVTAESTGTPDISSTYNSR